MKAFLKSNWPPLLLCFLVVLFLGDVCFGGKMLFLRDLFNGDLWSRVLAGNAFRSGHFPLWNSFVGGGFPFVANPYMGICYPPNWIFVLPATETAIRIWWVGHLSVAAISVYALGRHWRLDVGPALFGAVAFTFSTSLFAWLEFAQAITCLIWTPLVLLLVSLIIDRNAGVAVKTPLLVLLRGNAALIAGLAAVIALQILSSGEFFYYTAVLAGVYGVWKWVALRDPKAAARSLLQLAVAGGLGLMLAAPHLLAVLELVPYTDRVGEVDALAAIDSAHPRVWLSFISPFLYGRPGYPAAYWAKSIYEFAFGTCYVGILPVLGLFFSTCYFGSKNPHRDRRYLILFLVSVAGVSLVMAMGQFTPIFGLIHRYFPGYARFRYPTKFFLPLAGAMAALGAFGFQALLECRRAEDRQTQKRVLRFQLILLLCIVCALAVAGLSGKHSRLVGELSWVAAFWSIGIALFAAIVFEKLSTLYGCVTIVGVAFVNLWIVTRQVQPTFPGGIYKEQSDRVLKRLPRDPLYRAWTPYHTVAQYLYGEKRREILKWARETGGVSADWALNGVYGTTPVGFGISRYGLLFAMMGTPGEEGEAELKELKELMDQASRGKWNGAKGMNELRQMRGAVLSNKLADMLSISQVVSGEPYQQVLWRGGSKALNVTARSKPLPRAFLISQWRVEPDDDATLKVIASEGFDPHDEALIQASPGQTEPPHSDSASASEGGGVQSVSSFEDHQESLVIEAEPRQRSLLVLGDTWFPGWVAEVDGLERPIYQVNYAFRGVVLDPGKHRVVLTYHPSRFRSGLALGAFAVIACLGMAGVSLRNPSPVPVPFATPKPTLPASVQTSTKPARSRKAGKRKKM